MQHDRVCDVVVDVDVVDGEVSDGDKAEPVAKVQVWQQLVPASDLPREGKVRDAQPVCKRVLPPQAAFVVLAQPLMIHARHIQPEPL
eukprot:scaffold41434_cov63-Phaeocystis_antarctica.AAC.6